MDSPPTTTLSVGVPDTVNLPEGNIGGVDDVPTGRKRGGSASSDKSKLAEIPLADNLDTLDEPISETLFRDLRGIFAKVTHVALPTKSKNAAYRVLLKDWDLWGPLVMCTFFCLAVNHDPRADTSKGPHFAEVFLLIWLGFYVVGINFKLLATASSRRSQVALVPPSIFQLVCVFGYCLAAPCAGITVVKVLELIFDRSTIGHLFYEKLIIGFVFGFIWPTWACLRILSRYQSKDRHILASYPIGLLYFVISWFIIAAH